jgi:hypothetical protein
MKRPSTRLPRLGGASLTAAVIVSLISCGGAGTPALRGDWDYYRMLGAKPSGGFDALRRFGFAHFEKSDTTGAWINRRNGTRMERIHGLAVTGDSLVIDLASGTSIRAHISKAVRHRPLVYRDRHSAGASAARDGGVGGVPEVRPESQYRRG